MKYFIQITTPKLNRYIWSAHPDLSSATKELNNVPRELQARIIELYPDALR
jgi:hypothetical protein